MANSYGLTLNGVDFDPNTDNPNALKYQPSGTYQTQYYDGATGQTKNGYIIDGKTYNENGERISAGSRVRTADGNYYELNADGTTTNLTQSGLAGNTSTNAGGTGNDLINEIYRQQIEANQAALTAAYNKNVSNINAQIDALPALYNDARNKTASQSEVQRANFNEYAAANGLNSGAGGQAQLSFANTLQGNLSSLDKAQAGETSKYNLQLTQLASDYQNALQQALAQGNLDKTKALYQEYQTNKAYLQSQQELEYNRKVAQDETDFSRKLTLAQLGAQYGDFSGYAALGFTPEQIAKLTAEYNKTHTTKTTGGSRGGTPTPYAPPKSLDETPNETPPGSETEIGKAYETTMNSAYSTLKSLMDHGASADDISNILLSYISKGWLPKSVAEQLAQKLGIL